MAFDNKSFYFSSSCCFPSAEILETKDRKKKQRKKVYCVCSSHTFLNVKIHIRDPHTGSYECVLKLTAGSNDVWLPFLFCFYLRRFRFRRLRLGFSMLLSFYWKLHSNTWFVIWYLFDLMWTFIQPTRLLFMPIWYDLGTFAKTILVKKKFLNLEFLESFWLVIFPS